MKLIQTTLAKARPRVTATRGWRDLRVVIGAVALCAVTAPMISCTATQQPAKADTEVAALPQDVRNALDRASHVYPQPLAGAKWSRVHVMIESDHALYQVQGANGRGNKIELEATSAGRIIEVEEHGIPLSEVPDAVVGALKARFPGFEPAQVEAIYQVEKPEPVAYGLEGKDASGARMEVYFGADGKSLLK